MCSRSLDSTLYPHAWNLLFRTFFRYVPIPVLLMIRYLPSREYTRFRQFNKFMRNYARNVILPGSQAKENSKDMISVLIRANEAEDPRQKLEEYEVLDQISYVLLTRWCSLLLSGSLLYTAPCSSRATRRPPCP